MNTADPIALFQAELQKSIEASLPEPTAMQLATLGKDGFPEVRTVLFKGILRGGLSFYTNYESQKAQEIEQHPKVSLLFHWNARAVQVRIRGTVEKLARQESEAYFASRPRASQIGAWASPQSQIISDFSVVATRVKQFEEQFKDQVIPCPPHWGGFLVNPQTFEFWYGREGRLHDRFCYRRVSSQDWEFFVRGP